MASSMVEFELDGKVAIVRIDDGKANALSPGVLTSLDAALDRAEREAGAVLLVGRPGKLSAGFDLSVMTASADSARALVTQGAELLLRLYVHSQPVVVACTGHALAAGALLTLVADTRIGVRGSFKLGLNEVAIGMPLPIFAVELAKDRLSKRHVTAAALQARIYSPDEAVDAGYLDRVVDGGVLLAEALDCAKQLAELSRGAYARTKKLAREPLVAAIRATLEEDMQQIAPPANA